MTGRLVQFTIKVYPSKVDPHNWRWSVYWAEERSGEDLRERSHSGPGVQENVLSTPLAARQSAERYATTMGRNLMASDSYVFTVRPVDHA